MDESSALYHIIGLYGMCLQKQKQNQCLTINGIGKDSEMALT